MTWRVLALWLLLFVAVGVLAALIVLAVIHHGLTAMEMVMAYPWLWIALGAAVWGMVWLLGGEK